MSNVIEGGIIPEELRLSRVSLIYKDRGDKGDIANYRPITVTSVVYRVVMQVIKNRLQTWVEP